MMAPRISVLMSVYDGERHLAEAIESVLGQSLGDFELIVVDDGSTDGTDHILRSFAARDERVRVVQNESNVGLTRSLNRGLAAARGVYVARHDADDICAPRRFELQTRFLDARPDVALVCGAFERMDEDGRPLGRVTVPGDHDSLEATLLLMNPICHSSVMARRDSVSRAGGYDESFAFSQDYDLWWSIGRIGSLAALPEVVVRRRQGDAILSRTHGEEQAKCSLRVSLRAVKDSLGGEPLDEAAFSRFWWARRGQRHLLQSGDIGRLGPLWDLLARHPRGPAVWGPRLRRMGLGLARRGQVREGLALFWAGRLRAGGDRIAAGPRA